jgi:uncharacterized protein YbjT (DUF2867 family)
MVDKDIILVTGATGYIGGRFWRLLNRQGMNVRCMVRRPEYLEPHTQGTGVEVVRGDVLEPESLAEALSGVTTAYYLIHAIGAGKGFEEQEQEGAHNFGAAAAKAGVKRVIYLGGLAPDDENLSQHMRSRHATGRALAEGGVPVLEFRASIVIGAGSLSYEMIRSLVQRLPFMVTPSWTRVLAQPIAIDDLLEYLLEAHEIPLRGHEIYEIGGRDVVTYFQLMQTYAALRGKKIFAIPVPFLTPRLSSLWLGLVTPLFARIGRKLIDSCTKPSVVHDDRARQLFKVEPGSVETAIRKAQENEDHMFRETHWSDSISSARTSSSWGGTRFGTRLVDSDEAGTAASPEKTFAAVEKIGGKTGYYFADALWRMRSALDLLLGGVGMRRGRRDPEHLSPGDVVDFWRVEKLEPGKRLLLQSEMKLPGRAWLQFEVDPEGEGARLRQTAIFDPVGAAGMLYWYALYPLHIIIFKGMLRGVRREAESMD